MRSSWGVDLLQRSRSLPYFAPLVFQRLQTLLGLRPHSPVSGPNGDELRPSSTRLHTIIQDAVLVELVQFEVEVALRIVVFGPLENVVDIVEALGLVLSSEEPAAVFAVVNLMLRTMPTIADHHPAAAPTMEFQSEVAVSTFASVTSLSATHRVHEVDGDRMAGVRCTSRASRDIPTLITRLIEVRRVLRHNPRSFDPNTSQQIKSRRTLERSIAGSLEHPFEILPEVPSSGPYPCQHRRATSRLWIWTWHLVFSDQVR